MRKAFLVTACVMAAAAVACGDVFYLRDGKKYEGTGEQQGDKTVITLPIGATIEVPTADIIGVKASPVAKAGDRKQAASSHAPPEGMLMSTEKMDHPDAVAFAMMRDLAVGSAPGSLQTEIDYWRGVSHDRKRKVGSEWVSPNEFVRRRQAFIELLKSANDLLHKAQNPVHVAVPVVRDPNIKEQARLQVDAEKEQARRDFQAGSEMMEKAAQTWEDPLLRQFLMGLAYYVTKRYPEAEPLLRRCASLVPNIAGFHQAVALDLIEANRPLEALPETMAVMRLEDDSPESVALARLAMKKTPGADINNAAYLLVSKAVAGGKAVGGGQKAGNLPPAHDIAWMMPEDKDKRGWTAPANTLPTPPYDRLVFRQAIGVPVGKHTLLADAGAVKDALLLFVRIDANTLVLAQGRPLTAAGAHLPLMAVCLGGWEFSKPLGEEDVTLDAKAVVTAWGLGIFPELDEKPRQISCKVAEIAHDGGVKLKGGLLPGDVAGPIFTADGQLAGFLSPRTDVTADGGGGNNVIPLAQILPTIKLVKNYTLNAAGAMPARKKEAEATPQADGKTFLIYAVHGEKFN